MPSIFTEHARTRMQQRGIRADAIEALLDYGRASPAGDGCELVFFDKAARARPSGATLLSRGKPSAFAAPMRSSGGMAPWSRSGTAIGACRGGEP